MWLKKWILFSLVCAILFCYANDSSQASCKRLTFMSWNLRAGMGMDGVRNISRAASLIKKVNADFIALQEVDRKTLRSGKVDQVVELSSGTGRMATWCRAIDYDGGEYGIALLSKESPIRVDRIALPRQGQTEQRMLLLAEFADYIVGVTHLSLNEGERHAAIDQIKRYLSTQKPFLIAGDWNDVPESATLKKMSHSFAILSGEDKTYPAPHPTVCIDYIAVSQPHRSRLKVISHDVLSEKVISDHRPIVVVLQDNMK